MPATIDELILKFDEIAAEKDLSKLTSFVKENFIQTNRIHERDKYGFTIGEHLARRGNDYFAVCLQLKNLCPALSYNDFAAGAASVGQQELAIKYLKHLSLQERNYALIASKAASQGFHNLESFFKNLAQDVSEAVQCPANTASLTTPLHSRAGLKSNVGNRLKDDPSFEDSDDACSITPSLSNTVSAGSILSQEISFSGTSSSSNNSTNSSFITHPVDLLQALVTQRLEQVSQKLSSLIENELDHEQENDEVLSITMTYLPFKSGSTPTMPGHSNLSLRETLNHPIEQESISSSKAEVKLSNT